jgi:hypothetical protein
MGWMTGIPFQAGKGMFSLCDHPAFYQMGMGGGVMHEANHSPLPSIIEVKNV